jgi:hypothetical protein
VCELTEAAYSIREIDQNVDKGHERTHTHLQRARR